VNTIPNSHADLLSDSARAFAALATLMADGSPQITPLWFNIRGDRVLVNSAKGRVKDLNMRARPRVALVIVDPRDPGRYVQVRGQVVEITEEGGLAHMNALSLKYRGTPWTPIQGQIRVVYEIQPKSVFAA
jgi:PPOX class probable F420-dependent enzyme